MIGVEDLEFRYREGDFELAVEKLEIGSGEHVGIMGPSGSGKTTLLHLIAGIVTPGRGTIRVDEVEVSRLGDAARRDFRIEKIGLVFQEFELLEYLSVIDNILIPYHMGRSLRLDRSVRERALSLARRVGIGDKLGRLPDQLSQGERQRAAVCRALVTQPRLLLADEPTGNLDPDNKRIVLDILIDYAEEFGATLVVVTHDHDLHPRFTRRIDFKSLRSNPLQDAHEAPPDEEAP